MRALAASGAGFLLAVLWFDLMFDVQARGRGEVPADARASISAYYGRVTTAARPMNRLVAVVMLVTIGALAAEWVRDELPTWRAAGALAFTVVAVGLAAVHTVPNAVRLGRGDDTVTEQTRLARAILRDHVLCVALVGLVLVLQLAPT